jgi:RNA polymerase sigma factor (sigma-70 family)
MSEVHSVADFPLTIWTQVARAGDPTSREARAALSLLCEAYRAPIYALFLRKVQRVDRADDLTQDFLLKVLEKGMIARADRTRGRFRDFLRSSCHNFFLDQIRAQDPPHAPIELFEPADSWTPDREFERDYALALLKKTLDRLAQECSDAGKAKIFEILKPILTDGRGAVLGSILAERLGIDENTVHQWSFKLRKRYREILTKEVADTLADPSLLADEIQSLRRAVRR